MSDKTILLITCIFFLLLAGTPAVLSSPNEGVTTWGKSYDEIFAIPTPKPYGGWSYDEIFAISIPNKSFGGWSYDEIFAIPDYKPMFNRSWDDLFRG